MVRGRNRRCNADEQPGRCARGNAVGAQDDGLRLLVEADHDNDEIARLRQRTWTVGNRDAGLLRFTASAWINIASGHLETRFAQMASHRSPHLAEPDDTDATNDTLPHVPPSCYPSSSRIVGAILIAPATAQR